LFESMVPARARPGLNQGVPQLETGGARASAACPGLSSHYHRSACWSGTRARRLEGRASSRDPRGTGCGSARRSGRSC
jgi:hypothetical protein